MAEIDRVSIRDPDTGELLHEVLKVRRVQDSIRELRRLDFTEPIEYLQGAVIQIPRNYSFRPHIHLERKRSFENLRAQESWVVIKGTIDVQYYSENGTAIALETLSAGDISISFRGGHGFSTASSDALVYEFKSGPYEGVDVDKRFIPTPLRARSDDGEQS